MKQFVFSLLMIISCFTACQNPQSQQNTGRQSDMADSGTYRNNVSYKLAKNYFVRNDANLSGFSSPKIETEKAFEAMFGAAAVMGDENTPTPIDFNRQYAIAIINPVTDSATDLSVEHVQKAGDLITIAYTETIGEKQTMQTRPFLSLVLDRKDEGRIEVIKK